MSEDRWLRGAYGPPEADLARCVHCGLCLQHCPTYVETGLEAESPRGRLYLIRAMTNGRIEATPNALGHLDMCLLCRNCEAVCPSGVPYGRIMAAARAAALAAPYAPPAWRARALLLRHVVAHKSRLGLLVAALRFYRWSGLRSLAGRLPALRNRLVGPEVRGRPFTASGVLGRPVGPAQRRVAFLTGCIMPLVHGRVHRATVRVLAGNGCEVVAPPGQTCCGALHAHSGDIEAARRLARRNIDAFLAEPYDAIVVNSAGCGAALKEYPHLLAADPSYGPKAARLAALVRDVHQFLLEIDFHPPSAPLRRTVTYQDPCHLAHAQGIVSAPRQILEAIPGLELVEMEHPDRCCGSAGVYALTQPAMALRLLEAKMRDIAATRASIVATANPGCQMQLEVGLRRLGLPGRVVHTMELLDQAYRHENRSQVR